MEDRYRLQCLVKKSEEGEVVLNLNPVCCSQVSGFGRNTEAAFDDYADSLRQFLDEKGVAQVYQYVSKTGEELENMVKKYLLGNGGVSVVPSAVKEIKFNGSFNGAKFVIELYKLKETDSLRFE